jgi:thymidylate synthase
MFHFFDGTTADEVWRKAAKELTSGDFDIQGSRLGPVREFLHCGLCLSDPRQRWVLSRRPAINPAFAIAEVVWILLGRNDSAFLNYWNPSLPKFAGLSQSYHGAYGSRLRNNFGFDQIERAYQVLLANPDSRQVVLQIWDSVKDSPNPDGTSCDPDIPCNLLASLKIRLKKLEWLQVMRSSDIFLGIPHNFVQFTSLQEIIAGWLGVEVGSFMLVSDSLHLYEHDIARCSITDIPSTVRNTDTLALPKDEFARILPVIENAMDELRSENLSSIHLVSLIESLGLPIGWANVMYIVAADAARRHDWTDEMHAVARKCSNPALLEAWCAWLERRRCDRASISDGCA